MLVATSISGGENKEGDSSSGRERMRLYYRLLGKTQKATQAALTKQLIEEFGIIGGYEPRELVRHHRSYREAASELRLQAQAPHLNRPERAPLLGKAAKYETLADNCRNVLMRRLQPMLARAAFQIFPNGSYAYHEMREDFLQETALLVHRVLMPNTNTEFFEENHLFALVRMAFSAARTVGRKYGRGDGGKRPLPLELDASFGDADADFDVDSNEPLINLLPAPDGSNPEEQAFLSVLAAQLRELFVAASNQSRSLALRKFQVLCLRCADTKPAAVRQILSRGTESVESYSAESERTDFREAKRLLGKVLEGMANDLSKEDEVADVHEIERALRCEGQRLILVRHS
ncbi:MAG: hypothetical protein QM758_13700 [Armatimonas sp.]